MVYILLKEFRRQTTLIAPHILILPNHHHCEFIANMTEFPPHAILQFCFYLFIFWSHFCFITFPLQTKIPVFYSPLPKRFYALF